MSVTAQLATHCSSPADLDLPFMAIEDPSFSLDPVARFAAARRQHPWLAKVSVGYMLTEHAAMRDIMRNDASMAMGFNEVVDHMGATRTPWGDS